MHDLQVIYAINSKKNQVANDVIINSGLKQASVYRSLQKLKRLGLIKMPQSHFDNIITPIVKINIHIKYYRNEKS